MSVSVCLLDLFDFFDLVFFSLFCEIACYYAFVCLFNINASMLVALILNIYIQ